MYRNSAASPKSTKSSPALAVPTGVIDDTADGGDQEQVEGDPPAEDATPPSEDDGAEGVLDVATGLLGGIVKRDIQKVIGDYVGPVQTRPRMGWARILPSIAQNGTDASWSPALPSQVRPPTRAALRPLMDLNTSTLFLAPFLQSPERLPPTLPLAALPLALAAKAKDVTFLGMMFGELSLSSHIVPNAGLTPGPPFIPARHILRRQRRQLGFSARPILVLQ